VSVQAAVEAALSAGFAPDFLEVCNESAQHNVPPGSETHFRVTLVSGKFTGQKLVARHRAVNRAMADFLVGPVHALALHTYTPEEWTDRKDSPASPRCLGGGSKSK